MSLLEPVAKPLCLDALTHTPVRRPHTTATRQNSNALTAAPAGPNTGYGAGASLLLDHVQGEILRPAGSGPCGALGALGAPRYPQKQDILFPLGSNSLKIRH